jgi:dihydroxyacetone kinase
MKKIINDPMAFVDEMLEGILAAHGDQLRAASDPRAILRADAPVAGKVAILTGGGSGHLPVFMGYVGKGLADGASIGNVFSSPSAETMFEATLATNGGAGVLYLYGNYSGDTMNFDMAAEMADMEDIRVETVLVSDDVASAPRSN